MRHSASRTRRTVFPQRKLPSWTAGKKIVGVAIEEMGHLALVSNLLVAVGGAAHFDRPNLPVPPGYHPAAFVIRLMPFTKPTLDHFIYLERPADSPDPEGGGRYRQRTPLKRVATPGDLTPSRPITSQCPLRLCERGNCSHPSAGDGRRGADETSGS
jgi:hypothetical protein